MNSAEYRVYYEDTDAFGIMYHARHIAFAERARADALRALGAAPGALAEAHGIGFVVRRLGIEYRAPFRLDDLVRVQTRLAKLGRASCVLAQDLWCGQTHGAALEVDLACITLGDGRPARIPPLWRDAFEALR